MKEKVILAYSGGLDTTAIIPWLKENFDYEVICVRKRNLTDLMKELRAVVLQSFTLKILLTHLQKIT